MAVLTGRLVFLTCFLAILLINGINGQKQKLRVVSIMDEPYLMKGEDGDNDKLVGFCEDLAEKICDIIGYEHDIHLVKDQKYGQQNSSVKGGWTGIIGELINNEADLAIAPLTVNAARAQVVEFSTPFQSFQLSILMKEPEAEEDESDETLTCFSPFHLYLWLAIFFAIIGLVLISLIVEWSFKNPETHGEGFVNFLRQDSIFRPESVSGKVLRFVFFVFMIIVIGAYTASFSAQRNADSRSDVSIDIDSIEDLVKEDEMNFAVIQGGSTHAYLQASDNPVYKTLVEAMDAEDTAVENYAEGLEKVRLGTAETGRYAFLIESPKAEYFTSKEPCDLFTAREEFGPSRGYAVATPKGSPLSSAVNLAILKLKENGELEELLEKWWNDIACSDEEDSGESDSDDDGEVDEDDFDTLNLSEMAGLFYFLFAGLILILLVWILERRATSN